MGRMQSQLGELCWIKNGHDPNLILDWVDATPGGLYHLHGYGEIEGFASVLNVQKMQHILD